MRSRPLSTLTQPSMSGGADSTSTCERAKRSAASSARATSVSVPSRARRRTVPVLTGWTVSRPRPRPSYKKLLLSRQVGGKRLANGGLCRRLEVLELEDVQLGEPLAQPGREEPETLHVRDYLREQHLAELDHRRRVEDDLLGLLDGEPHRLPDLLREQSVSHETAALEDELLALAPLVRRHVAEVVVERDDAEGHVPRLVADNVVEEVGQERLGARLVHEAERRHRQAFHHDLHAEVLHVPARVGEDLVEQGLQVRVDPVRSAQLLVQVARE